MIQISHLEQMLPQLIIPRITRLSRESILILFVLVELSLRICHDEAMHVGIKSITVLSLLSELFLRLRTMNLRIIIDGFAPTDLDVSIHLLDVGLLVFVTFCLAAEGFVGFTKGLGEVQTAPFA